MNRLNPLASLLVCSALCFLHATASAQNEVGFLERFALSHDRLSALGELVPGSADYYYYHALHAQNSGDAARFAEVIAEWTKRHPGELQQRKTLLHRQALLDYEKKPKATFAYLRDKLGVQFPHTRETPGVPSSLPDKINESLISTEAFEKDVLSGNDSLTGIPGYALDSWIPRHATLSATRRTVLLDRIEFSEAEGLVDLVAWDLQRENARPFGSRPIHSNLLPKQLDELEKKIPSISNDAHFVRARLRQLIPSAEVDLEFNLAAREAWLESLWKYASRLPYSFNSLKANILFRRLQHDRSQGIYDRERFLEYLKLPKRNPYSNPDILGSADFSSKETSLNRSFQEELGDAFAIGSDEALVREFFLHLFDAAARANPSAGEELARPFYSLVQSTWLRPILAEALITGGHGSPETWASLLSPPMFQALKDRTDVEFPADNPPFIRPGSDVKFDVWVKNTPSLTVNVYEVNALNFFLQQKRQINTDLNVDGLIPNLQKSIPINHGVFLRHRVTVTLPELKNKRGIWLVEVIGGGRSSRALVRVGQWNALFNTGPSGVQVTLLDETRNPVRDGVAWMDGRRFEPDPKTGTLTLPFLNAGPARPVVFSDPKGEFAILEQFQPQPESFQLDAAFHLEREQIIGGAEPVLGLRVALRLGPIRLDPSLLKDSSLRIRSQTRTGVASVLEIKNPTIPAAGVFEQKVRIPEDVVSLSAEYSAKVDTISQGAGSSVTLQASKTWEVNGIDASSNMAQAFLYKEAAAAGEDWIFLLTGKNGEPSAGKAITFKFHRIGFGNPRSQQIKTDLSGRVRLGLLHGIQHVDASGDGFFNKGWDLFSSHVSWPTQIHAASGSEIRIPALPERAFERDWILTEHRRGTVVRSLRPNVRLEKGFYVVRGLDPGDYTFKSPFLNTLVEIRVTAGARVGDWLLGDARHLEAGGTSSGLQLISSEAKDDHLTVQFSGNTPQTRVHLVARAFLDSHNLFTSLGQFHRWGLAIGIPSRLPNLFSAGRRIGDEFRYILERKTVQKFPGLMLPRPGLLLNPWETRDTQSTELKQAAGEAAKSTLGDRQAANLAAKLQAAAAPTFGRDASAESSASPNLDFLNQPAVILWNLRLDESGTLKIPLALIADRQMVQLYADDGLHCVWREIAVRPARPESRDRRMLEPFDPARRFSETRQTAAKNAGERVRFADAATTEIETFDSIEDALRLFQSIRPDLPLAQWAWISQWASLSDAEKKARYSEFACHEIHLFLWRKDPAFFESVIRPYLASKAQRTFVDGFLLDENLSKHLEPANYEKLNSMEKALLAWRIPNEKMAAARHLREQVQKIPQDREQWRMLFDAALRSRSLSLTGRLLAEAEQDRGAGKGMAFSAMVPHSVAVAASNALSEPAEGDARSLASQRQSSMNGLTADKNAMALAGAANAKPRKAVAGFIEAQEKAASDEKELRAKGEALREERILSRDGDLAKRKDARAYFHPLGSTKEFAESNYYKVRLNQQSPGLVPPSLFWQEFGEWIATGAQNPFLSGRFPEASHNLNEILLAIAFLDLPFAGDRPTLKREEAAVVLHIHAPSVIFHRQIQPAEAPQGVSAAQITQSFARLDDRYSLQDGERVEKTISGDFLVGVPYVSSVVVGNPTAAHLKADLLWQIPSGAIPLNGSARTHSQPINIGPFATAMFEFSFYFPSPSPGNTKGFICHPASVTSLNRGTAQAVPRILRVLEGAVQTDQTSWAYISQNGTPEDVFEFLEKNTLHDTDLSKIAWRCQDKTFFERIYGVLRSRHVWNAAIASYALKHELPSASREWLLHQQSFVNECGPFLRTKLLAIEPEEQGTYEHLQFAPLINPRAHRAGSEWRIANSAVFSQYTRLLSILAHKPHVERADKLAVCASLLLQDRIAEAQTWFAGLDSDQPDTALQYDYMKATLNLLHGRNADARTVASKYTQYPVDRWRLLFSELVNHLDVSEGKPVSALPQSKPDREHQTDDLAKTEPSLDAETNGKQIKIWVRNLRSVQLKFYPTDPEFSFSANPFSREDSGTFRFIQPFVSLEKNIPEGAAEVVVPIPENLTSASLMVEIVGAGLRRTINYSPSMLHASFIENYGRLEVRDPANQRPVAKIYVKVYARLNSGAVRFFKDGYTDIRGRFDYASLNSSKAPVHPALRIALQENDAMQHPAIQAGELNDVQKFSVLVVGETGGAVIRELAAPSRSD